MRTAIGEIGAIKTDGSPACQADAARLLIGYAGSPSAVWVDGPVAFAGSGGAELASDDELVVLVDARLDNRVDLVRQFGGSTEDSSARLLLMAWRRAGAGLVDSLVGEVAGIVYERSSRRLHAFRDLCAGRPLHVSRFHDAWAIASEWQPLVSAGSFRSRPDPEWFAGACSGTPVNPRATPYLGVEMVLPGHVASPASRSWRQERHARWHVTELDDRRTGAYRDQFRELFDHAVRCRLVDPDGVGVSLSGGLDSTSVMATAAAVAEHIPRTALCMPMTDESADERAIQAEVATRAGARLHWVDISRCAPMGPEGPEALFERDGGPPPIINWSLGDAVAESAAAAGLRVIMDGEDGDSLLGGNPAFFADLVAQGRLRTWAHEWRALRDAEVTGGRHLAGLTAYLLAPPLVRRLHDRIRQVPQTPDFIPTELSARLDLKKKIEAGSLRRVWAPGRAFAAVQRTAGDPEYLGPMLTQIAYPWRLRGIATSHPFTDRRLMSFCMGLPYEHVYRGGWSKIVLRQAMHDRLPYDVVTRPGKADISEVARRAAYGRDLDYVKAGLRLARQQTDWFDANAVAEIESSFLAKRNNLAIALRVSMMGWWLRWCETA